MYLVLSSSCIGLFKDLVIYFGKQHFIGRESHMHQEAGLPGLVHSSDGPNDKAKVRIQVLDPGVPHGRQEPT